MSNVIPVHFKTKTLRDFEYRHVALADLSPSDLVCLIMAVADEARLRGDELRGQHYTDHQGRKWAMPAVMRAVMRSYEYLGHKVGKGVIQ